MDTEGRLPQRSTSSNRVESSRFSDKFNSNTAELLNRKKEVGKVVAASVLEHAKEYQQEARRLQALREAVGLSGNLVDQQVNEDLAGLADVWDLNQVDTSSYLVALADSDLSEWKLDDRQAKLSQERLNLDGLIQRSVRRRIALEKLLKQLKVAEVKQGNELQKWSTELEALREKEQTESQEAESEDKLRQLGFTSDISHRTILKLAQEKTILEAHLRPILERLKKFSDLPPDVERAKILVQQKEEEVQEWKLLFDEKLSERMTDNDMG